jgi:hypothetical protein
MDKTDDEQNGIHRFFSAADWLFAGNCIWHFLFTTFTDLYKLSLATTTGAGNKAKIFAAER